MSDTQFLGGSVSKGSELQIEVAEFLWKDVEVTIKKIILHVLCPSVPN
jgi:UTP---glucose-1-phosphate uridylyltransferase